MNQFESEQLQLSGPGLHDDHLNALVGALMDAYRQFDMTLVEKLGQLYADDLVFIDPLHEIHGINNLTDYFSKMIQGITYCRFEFHRWLGQTSGGANSEAVLFWTMHYSHPQLAGGGPLQLEGNSHIRIADKIVYHRDYFDAGAMLYERLPVLGWAIKKIKQRMN